MDEENLRVRKLASAVNARVDRGKMLKIYIQASHPSDERLAPLLRQNGMCPVDAEEWATGVKDRCAVCQATKVQPRPRPVMPATVWEGYVLKLI